MDNIKLFEEIYRKSNLKEGFDYEDKRNVDIYREKMEKAVSEYISILSKFYSWDESTYEKYMKDIIR